MTRQEAIQAIVGAWKGNDGEFCISRKEREESDAEMREALTALGVTAEELPPRSVSPVFDSSGELVKSGS